jgi:hypothetical protein
MVGADRSPASTNTTLPDAPDESTLRAWHFKQLRASLRSLTASASDQPALFPEFVATPEELALQFQHWASVVRSAYDDELSEAERDSLAALDSKFVRMSRDGAEFDLDLWTDTALKSHGHWSDVRALAAAALEAFGSRGPAESGESEGTTGV